MSNIEELVRSNLKDNQIIVTFFNHNYRNLAKIWCEQMEKKNITNYVIIASEQSAYDALKDNNFNLGLRVKIEKNFWTYEITVTKMIFDYGVDVIHSDLDAIWKEDATQHMTDKNIDLYFSQGLGFPKDVFNKNGFCMCYGFWFLRNNERTQKLFNDWVEDSFKTYDHQISINRLLVATKWDRENVEEKKVKHIVYWNNDIYGENEAFNIKTCLLSMNKIQRLYIDENAWIYHLSAEKVESEKFKIFEKYNIL